MYNKDILIVDKRIQWRSTSIEFEITFLRNVIFQIFILILYSFLQKFTNFNIKNYYIKKVL